MKKALIDLARWLILANVIALGCAGFIDVMNVIFDAPRDTDVYFRMVVIANFIVGFILVLFILIAILFPDSIKHKPKE